jgi:hypothetical protein
MEHIPATHAAKVGMHFPARVTSTAETGLELELDLTLIAPGRDPTLRALLRFDLTLAPEQARRLAIGDAVNVVMIGSCLHGWMPSPPTLRVSLPADPAWLTWNDETVRRLARHICQTNEAGLLPILADALEEAGCTDAAFLDCCRRPPEEGLWEWAVSLLATQQ